MSWEIISVISELIGTAVVIVFLSYLAFQIRQIIHQNTLRINDNKNSYKAISASTSAARLRETRQAIFESLEVTECWLKGLYHPEQLTGPEAFRFRLVMQSIFDATWDLHTHTIAADVFLEVWNTQGVKLIERVAGTPGGGEIWDKFREAYPSQYRLDVDRILNGRLVKPVQAM